LRQPQFRPRSPSRSIPRRLLAHWRLLLMVALVGAGTLGGAVSTNAFGAGDRFEGVLRRLDRFIAGPVPERSTRPTITVTAPPVAAATPTLAPTPGPTLRPSSGSIPPSSGATATTPTATTAPSPSPAPTAAPTPARVAVDVDLLSDPESVFNHQLTKDWCAVAGTQMVLSIHGKGDTSEAFQQTIASRVREWESLSDSRNGNWGPAAMALALEAYGVPGYEVRAYESRLHALRDSARAIAETGAPVVLLTWRGAHTWVMTGFRADADPTLFSDADVSGAYILDPWYPSVSSIWGPSNPPGFFTGIDELVENFLPWERPEGSYPDRDGKFIAVVPTAPLDR